MLKNMSLEEFEKWKIDWGNKIPQCNRFVCCHEMDSCAIKVFCNQGSIYDTYIKDKHPRECVGVGCADCLLKYECEEIKTR